MTVGELIIRLGRLNPNLDICLEKDNDVVTDFTVDNLMESHEDDTVIGYIICAAEPEKQMELPFGMGWDEKKGMN